MHLLNFLPGSCCPLTACLFRIHMICSCGIITNHHSASINNCYLHSPPTCHLSNDLLQKYINNSTRLLVCRIHSQYLLKFVPILNATQAFHTKSLLQIYLLRVYSRHDSALPLFFGTMAVVPWWLQRLTSSPHEDHQRLEEVRSVARVEKCFIPKDALHLLRKLYIVVQKPCTMYVYYVYICVLYIHDTYIYISYVYYIYIYISCHLGYLVWCHLRLYCVIYHHLPDLTSESWRGRQQFWASWGWGGIG